MAERYEVRIQTPIGWQKIGDTEDLAVAAEVAKLHADNERSVGRVIDMSENDSFLAIAYEHIGPPPELDPWEQNLDYPREDDGCDWMADGF